MEKIKFKNGLRVIHQKNNSNLVTINIAVIVGSINETNKTKGISHFIEHMLFEGTKNRSAEKITAEIEQFGGEINAYTSNEKTNYYIKIHKKHFEKSLEILSDMIINPSFDTMAIKKEKGVVLEEINMDNDEPKNYQWTLFQKSLFTKSFGYEIYGTKETLLSLSKKQLENFHKKFYTPNNIIITIVGDIKNHKNLIKKYFKFNNKSIIKKRILCKAVKSQQIIKEKKKNISLNYLIIGYNTSSRLKRESYILDIIQSILSKGQSGRLFVEIRTKRGLTYSVGICHHSAPQYGFFAFYTSAEKSKIEIIEKIYFEELNKLTNVKTKDINDAKSYIEGQLALRDEDSQDLADSISLFEECGNLNKFKTYIKEIKSITKEEIITMSKKLINSNYTKVLLH